MVEYSLELNSVFGSLADATRRDILRRTSVGELSISEIALPYDLTFAAVSKHLQILERAKLIVKRRRGKHVFVHTSPASMQDALKYLNFYQNMLASRYDSLDKHLRKEK